MESRKRVGQASPVTERGEAHLRAENDPRWYALHVRSNHEKKAYAYLRTRALETFLPQYRVQSRRRDRTVRIHKPLFAGYVFVRTRLEQGERLAILKTPGLVRIVGFEEGPHPVPDDVLESLRILVGSGRDPEPFPFLTGGKRVRVVGGPLSGMEGFVVESQDRKQRVVVSIELLGRSVAARLERERLEPV